MNFVLVMGKIETDGKCHRTPEIYAIRNATFTQTPVIIVILDIFVVVSMLLEYICMYSRHTMRIY